MRALCLARMGRNDEAEKSVAEVEGWLRRLPRALSEPVRLHLRGELALARGDHAEAIAVLKKAAEAKPIQGLKADEQAVDIQYALARTALEGGRSEEARAALAHILDAGPARVFAPVRYVRSLALLAALEEKAGHTEKAFRLYERYLGYWKHGGIDSDEVARAGRRLASLRSRLRSRPAA
jgi:tetratricopeptide (TPR) repeat protein